MTSDKKHTVSFGRYLKSVRIEKGIDLTSIAEETKISHSILVNLENEHHEHLPSPLFVKGFIRGYADVVGADASLAEKSYEDSLEKYKEATIPASELSKRKTVFRYYVTALPFVLVGIMIFSIWLLSDTRPVSNEGAKTPPSEIINSPGPTEPPVSHDLQADKTPLPETDVLTLAVSAVDKTWLKIIIDDQSPKEYQLEPGDHLELEAESKFNILAGNASGVKLLFNNKPVSISGNRGQVVTVKLP